MAGRGGRRPGAGRKSNAQEAQEREAFLVALGDQREQVEAWMRLLASPDERTVLETMKYLTNRAYGRPKEAVSAPKHEVIRVEVLRPQRLAGRKIKKSSAAAA